MKLVLLRHGESEWNLENRFTGWTDVDLSDNGRKEALSAGKALLDGGYDFDICYTSYLKRAIHTLDAVLDVMDRAWLPVIKSYKLNERHYGALQGLNKSETAEKFGEEQVLIWRRSFDVRPPVLEPTDERNPANQAQYRDEDKSNFRSARASRTRLQEPFRILKTRSRRKCARASALLSRRTAIRCVRSSCILKS